MKDCARRWMVSQFRQSFAMKLMAASLQWSHWNVPLNGTPRAHLNGNKVLIFLVFSRNLIDFLSVFSMGKTSLPLSSNITPSTSFMGKKPLGLITSYIYNCQTLDGGSQSEPPTKRLKTPHDAPHSPKVSQSTAKKSTTNKKSTRRNLFCNNRKISEFFHTP